jgi:hypothetical protein
LAIAVTKDAEFSSACHKTGGGMCAREPRYQRLQDKDCDRNLDDRPPQLPQGCNEFAHDILSPEPLA